MSEISPGRIRLTPPDYECDGRESDLTCEIPDCGRRARSVWFDGLRFVCKSCAGKLAGAMEVA